MNGLIFLIGALSFGLAIWLSIVVSNFHYKIKDTDAPLYFIYGFIFVAIWGAIAMEFTT